MSMLDYPDFKKMDQVHKIDFTVLTDRYNLMKCYSAFKVEFQFPPTVVYPNIPVSLDESNIIFPSSGTSYCTGVELLLAQKLGCTLQILDGVIIPFKHYSENGESIGGKISYSPHRIEYVCDERISDFVNKAVYFKRSIDNIETIMKDPITNTKTKTKTTSNSNSNSSTDL